MSQRGSGAGTSVHKPITDRRKQAPKMYRKKKVNRKTGIDAKPRAHGGGSVVGARGSAGKSYGKPKQKSIGNVGGFRGAGFGRF